MRTVSSHPSGDDSALALAAARELQLSLATCVHRVL